MTRWVLLLHERSIFHLKSCDWKSFKLILMAWPKHLSKARQWKWYSRLSISINKSAAEASTTDINMYRKLLSTTYWRHATCKLTVTGVAQMVLMHTATSKMTDSTAWFSLIRILYFMLVPIPYSCVPEMHSNWVNPKTPLSGKFILSQMMYFGRGGSLVDSSPFVRRVTGSNPTLAAM